MGTIIYALGGLVLSLVLHFLPSIIAFVRNNSNKTEVLLLNGIPYCLSMIFVFVEVPFLNMIVNVINIVMWAIALIKAVRD